MTIGGRQPCERFAAKIDRSRNLIRQLFEVYVFNYDIFLLEQLPSCCHGGRNSVTRNVYKSRKQVMIRGLPAHVGMSLTCVAPADTTEKPKVASQFIRLSSIKEWMGESIKEIPISKQAINPFRIEGIINV